MDVEETRFWKLRRGDGSSSTKERSNDGGQTHKHNVQTEHLIISKTRKEVEEMNGREYACKGGGNQLRKNAFTDACVNMKNIRE